MDRIRESSSPTALGVRDDRINLFVDLRYLKRVNYYAVRAVSPGIYKWGTVSVDAIYKEEYHSYVGAGTIQVVQ
jgi:uncharacterized protein YfaS (alpha-2-macroglobulin family)